jgi:hypothetical protein
VIVSEQPNFGYTAQILDIGEAVFFVVPLHDTKTNSGAIEKAGQQM